MTAPDLMTDHPTEETLAAYIDDRLDAPTRRTVTEHIASCGECRELVMMATDFQSSETPANVVRGPFGWLATAAALAAAAVIAIFVLRPAFLFAPDMDDVHTAAQELDVWPTVGRFAGAPYKKAYSPPRGVGDDELADAKLLNIAAEARDPHVRGMATFLGGPQGELFRDAVADLEEAYKNAPPGDRDEIALDLAAALLSSWSNERGYQRALELSDEVLKRKQSPEASFNRAAALERLGRDEEAIAAWSDYLALDPNSEWAKEAEKRKNELIELTRR